MKNKALVCFLIAVMIAAFTPCSFAAYPVKLPVRTEATVTAYKKQPFAERAADKLYSAAQRVERVLHKEHSILPERQKNDTLGLLSLIFGIAGLVFFGYGFLFSIAAIVLGVEGKRRDERYAHTGLILGIVALAIEVLLLILIIALISTITL